MKLFKIGMLFLVTGMFTITANAQSSELIWKPEFSYSWKSSDRLGFSSKLAMFNSISNLDNNQAIEYIEPQLSFSYSLTPRFKVGGGYLYRYSTPLVDGYQYEHRFSQQVGFVSYIGDDRLSHRVKLEQRIRSSTYLNRFRYRLSYDFPLEGDRLDPGEKYLLVNNEVLALFNKQGSSGQNRIKAALGWYFNQQQKFELGLQYRTTNLFNSGGIGHVFVLYTSYYMNR